MKRWEMPGVFVVGKKDGFVASVHAYDNRWFGEVDAPDGTRVWWGLYGGLWGLNRAHRKAIKKLVKVTGFLTQATIEGVRDGSD